MNRSSSGGRPRAAAVIGWAFLVALAGANVAPAGVDPPAVESPDAGPAEPEAQTGPDAGPDAQPAAEPAETGYAVRALSQEERKIRQALAEPLKTPLELTDNTLAEALQFVGSSHGVRLFADQAALAEAQLDLGELRTSLVIEDVPLGHALNLLLGPSGLAYVVEDSVLKITTQQRLEDTFERVVYDVAPLERAGFTSLNLAEVVQRTVRPQQWEESRRAVSTGFPGEREKERAVRYGSLQPVPGGLVVWHSVPAQREIEQLLGQLHRLAERQRLEQQRAAQPPELQPEPQYPPPIRPPARTPEDGAPFR